MTYPPCDVKVNNPIPRPFLMGAHLFLLVPIPTLIWEGSAAALVIKYGRHRALLSISAQSVRS